jgi:hypothetical protein
VTAVDLERAFVLPFFALLGVIGIHSPWRVVTSGFAPVWIGTLVVVGASLVVLWHGSPVLLWHLRLEDQPRERPSRAARCGSSRSHRDAGTRRNPDGTGAAEIMDR